MSVIINAYNGARYLKETIASVYSQTLQDFEIILFDDASTDETPTFASGYDKRLRYFRCEERVPLGEARNRALELARGEFISFLDQDDLFLPTKLGKQVARFQGNMGLVFSNSIRFWESTGQEALLYASPPKEGDAFRALLKNYYLSINTVMIRRSALPTQREWWFPSSFKMSEEADFFLRLAYLHPIGYVDEPLAKYRHHAENFTLRHPELVVSEMNMIAKRLEQFIPDFKTRYADEFAAYKSQIKRIEARIHWKEGRRAHTLATYLQSFCLSPKPVVVVEMVMSSAMSYSACAALRQRFGRPL